MNTEIMKKIMQDENSKALMTKYEVKNENYCCLYVGLLLIHITEQKQH